MKEVLEKRRTEEFVKVLDACEFKFQGIDNIMQPSQLFWSTLKHLPEPHKTEFLGMAVEMQEVMAGKSIATIIKNWKKLKRKTGIKFPPFLTLAVRHKRRDPIKPELLRKIREFEPTNNQ